MMSHLTSMMTHDKAGGQFKVGTLAAYCELSRAGYWVSPLLLGSIVWKTGGSIDRMIGGAGLGSGV